MKGFMKGCAITALAMAAIGIVLGGIGGHMVDNDQISQVVESVTGGRVHVNGMNWWRGINIGSGDVREDFAYIVDYGQTEFLESGTYMDGVDDWTWGSIGDDYKIVQDKDALFDKKHDIIEGSMGRYSPGDGIRKLDIEVGGCQFYTDESYDGSIYLEVGNAYRFQGYVEGETLYVKSKVDSLASWSNGDCWITLYLPEGYWFDDVEVELGAGTLYFTELNAEEVSLEVGAGQIDIQQVNAGKLDLSVGAGSVWLSEMRIEKLDAEVGMGEFTAMGAVEEELEVECSMGQVSLTLEGSEDDFNYHVEGSMGNIWLGNNSYVGFGKEKDINNHADKEMDIECSMGNITISFMN